MVNVSSSTRLHYLLHPGYCVAITLGNYTTNCLDCTYIRINPPTTLFFLIPSLLNLPFNTQYQPNMTEAVLPKDFLWGFATARSAFCTF